MVWLDYDYRVLLSCILGIEKCSLAFDFARWEGQMLVTISVRVLNLFVASDAREIAKSLHWKI